MKPFKVIFIAILLFMNCFTQSNEIISGYLRDGLYHPLVMYSDGQLKKVEFENMTIKGKLYNAFYNIDNNLKVIDEEIDVDIYNGDTLKIGFTNSERTDTLNYYTNQKAFSSKALHRNKHEIQMEFINFFSRHPSMGSIFFSLRFIGNLGVFQIKPW